MERRSFLTWATHGMGALWAAVLGLPGIAYLIDARNRPAPPGEFKPTGLRWNELAVGVPKQAVIKAVRRDAWTYHPNDVLGGVWLVKQEDGKVVAFTMTCPHLGCPISGFDPASKQFGCPCHRGAFRLNGELVTEAELGRKNAPPRGMDQLDVKFADDNGHEIANPTLKGHEIPGAAVLVKFQKFEQNNPEKILRT